MRTKRTRVTKHRSIFGAAKVICISAPTFWTFLGPQMCCAPSTRLPWRCWRTVLGLRASIAAPPAQVPFFSPSSFHVVKHDEKCLSTRMSTFLHVPIISNKQVPRISTGCHSVRHHWTWRCRSWYLRGWTPWHLWRLEMQRICPGRPKQPKNDGLVERLEPIGTCIKSRRNGYDMNQPNIRILKAQKRLAHDLMEFSQQCANTYQDKKTGTAKSTNQTSAESRQKVNSHAWL
jgi:hypothetical protein